jgi:CO dehydrogenase maturation factor
LLVLGTIERGGSGCMCPASSFLKALMRHVILKMNSVVILDMEAGIEHLGRGTTKGIDYMIIVVEPGARSIDTAGRIAELGRQIGISKFGVVINKVGDEVKEIEEKLQAFDLPVIGMIPFDGNLVKADLANVSPIEGNSSAILSINRIFEKFTSKME